MTEDKKLIDETLKGFDYGKFSTYQMDLIRGLLEQALSSANKQIEELKRTADLQHKEYRKLWMKCNDLKHQFQTQRDEIFKIINIELRCSSSDLKVGEVCEDEDCLNCSKKNDILRKIEHLKQTHKEKK